MRDEYELLAYNDLIVAHAHLDIVGTTLRSLLADFDPRADDLQQAYLGLCEFSDKYKHRLQDYAAIYKLIDEARAKHRVVLSKLSDAQDEISRLTGENERAVSEALSLTSHNEQLKAEIDKIKSQIKQLGIV